jgi:hypothetical protein
MASAQAFMRFDAEPRRMIFPLDWITHCQSLPVKETL